MAQVPGKAAGLGPSIALPANAMPWLGRAGFGMNLDMLRTLLAPSLSPIPRTQAANCRASVATCILACATILMQGGCATLGRSGPCDEDQVAARELARVGLESMRQGHTPEARSKFEQALQLCPRDPDARRHLAQLQWENAEYEAAIQEMQVAMKDSGEAPECVIQLGKMQEASGNLAEALKCAESATNTNPQLAEGWLLRGNIFARRHQAEESKRAYHRCLSCDDLTSETELNASLALAELYRLEGRPLRALATLERCQRGMPRDRRNLPTVAYERAVAMHALGRYEDAIDQFQIVLQRHQDHHECLLMLADCQFRTGQREAAQNVADQLQRCAPNDPRVAALQADLRVAGHAIVEHR